MRYYRYKRTSKYIQYILKKYIITICDSVIIILLQIQQYGT